MLGKEFILEYYRREQHNRLLKEADPPPKHFSKGVLEFNDTIQQYVQQPLDRTAYSLVLNAIHQESEKTLKYSFPLDGVLDPNVPIVYPTRNELPHDTNHLFTCHLKPTLLTPVSFSADPDETACFLGLPLDDLGD